MSICMFLLSISYEFSAAHEWINEIPSIHILTNYKALLKIGMNLAFSYSLKQAIYPKLAGSDPLPMHW